MEKEITAKSSKHEIIEAYNELLTKVKEQNNTNSRAINEKEEHKKKKRREDLEQDFEATGKLVDTII